MVSIPAGLIGLGLFLIIIAVALIATVIHGSS